MALGAHTERTVRLRQQNSFVNICESKFLISQQIICELNLVWSTIKFGCKNTNKNVFLSQKKNIFSEQKAKMK